TAAARARAIGDQALFARAAFGAHRVAAATESSRFAVIDLLEEALAGSALSAEGGRERWLISASLAREFADGPHRDLARGVELARTAVDGARAAGQASALAYALLALTDVRWEQGTAAERLSLSGELAAVATAAGETELVLEAQLARLVALLELGDQAFTVEL